MGQHGEVAPLEAGEVHVSPESELLRRRRHTTTTVPALGTLGPLCGLGHFTTREPLLRVGLGDRLKLGLEQLSQLLWRQPSRP